MTTTAMQLPHIIASSLEISHDLNDQSLNPSMHHYNLHHLLMYRRMEDDLQPVENFEIRLMIYQCNIYLEFHVDLIVFFPCVFFQLSSIYYVF